MHGCLVFEVAQCQFVFILLKHGSKIMAWLKETAWFYLKSIGHFISKYISHEILLSYLPTGIKGGWFLGDIFGQKTQTSMIPNIQYYYTV